MFRADRKVARIAVRGEARDGDAGKRVTPKMFDPLNDHTSLEAIHGRAE
jgi:hypothetical protein